MNRIVGIVILVLGVLLLVAHFVLKMQDVPAGFGITTTLIGAAVFGLSFIRQTEPGPNAPNPLSPADRVTRVFYEPEPVFKNLRFYPRWLAAFLVIAVFVIVYQVAYTQRLGVAKITSDNLDRAIAGGFIPQENADQIKAAVIAQAEHQGIVAKVIGPLQSVNGFFIITLLLAAVYLLCVMAFGGKINFFQSLAIATYSALPPFVISMILSLVLLYVKSPDDLEALRVQRGLARADLGLLISAASHPYIYTIASFIGIFNLYGWWLSATGLRQTGEKISSGSAWTIVFLVWMLGVLLLLVGAMLAPTFVG
jgi:hypothetical protein